MKSNREHSLSRFTNIPEPGNYSTQFGPLVPSQYFRQLFQFTISRGWMNHKDVEVITGEHTKTRTRTFTSSKIPRSQTKLKRDIRQFMDSFLRLPQQFSCSWAEIFHTRLIRSPHIMEPVHINGMKNLIFHFLERCDKEMSASATNLLNYINSHFQDIDNALIGLTPSSFVLEQFEKFTSQISESSENNQANINCYTKDQLLQKLYKWSEMDDLTDIGISVKEFVKSLQYQFLHELRQGDLVVVRLPKEESSKEKEIEKEKQTLSLLKKEFEMQNISFSLLLEEGESYNPNVASSNIIIARFCKVEGDKVLVWHSPDERSTVRILMTEIFPFTKNADILEMLHTQRGMKRLVEDEIDKMNLVLKDNIRNLVNEYLQQNNISLNLLERANENNVSLLDVKNLETTLETLRKLNGRVKEELLDKVEHKINCVIQFLQPNISITKLFHPTRIDIEKTFSSWPYVSLAENRIKRYTEVCRSAMEQVHSEFIAIQNSSLKHSLSEWWLSLIHDKVYDTLEKAGYDFSVVPENYIDNPPSSMDAVRTNLDIVRKFLKPQDDAYNLLPLVITPLRELIYPRLNQFEEKMKAFLLVQSFSPMHDLQDFNLDTFRSAFELEKKNNRLTEEECEIYENIMMDIQYISKMRLLDSEMGILSSDSPPRISDAVPISGLALNYFHRMEMELRTVLDIWGHSRRNKLSQANKRVSLEINRGSSARPPVKSVCVTRQKTDNAIRFPSQNHLKSAVLKLPKPPQPPKCSPREPSSSVPNRLPPTPPASPIHDLPNKFNNNSPTDLSDSLSEMADSPEDEDPSSHDQSFLCGKPPSPPLTLSLTLSNDDILHAHDANVPTRRRWSKTAMAGTIPLPAEQQRSSRSLLVDLFSSSANNRKHHSVLMDLATYKQTTQNTTPLSEDEGKNLERSRSTIFILDIPPVDKQPDNKLDRSISDGKLVKNFHEQEQIRKQKRGAVTLSQGELLSLKQNLT